MKQNDSHGLRIFNEWSYCHAYIKQEKNTVHTLLAKTQQTPSREKKNFFRNVLVVYQNSGNVKAAGFLLCTEGLSLNKFDTYI